MPLMSSPANADSTPNAASRELIGLCVGASFVFVVFTMSGPLVPLMLMDLGASPSLLGLVLSVSAIGSLVVGVPGGLLVKRFGTRLPIIAGGGLVAASTLFLGFYPTIPGLFIGLSLMEVGKIILILGAQAHVGHLGENRDVNLDFGWYSSAAAAGQMIGPSAAGLCIDHIGIVPTWFIMTGLMAATIAFFPFLISGGAGRNDGADPARATDEKKRRTFRRLFNMAGLIAILASFAVLFAMGTHTSFYPVLLREHFGYSATVIGALMSLRGFTSISVRLFMAPLIRVAGGPMPALIAAVFVVGIGIAAIPLCGTIWLLALNALVLGAGIGLAIPLSMAAVTSGVDREDRGMAIGVRLSGNRLAQVLNPAFFGLVAQGFGLSIAFYTGGVLLTLTCLPILLWWARSRTESGQGRQ
jgi:MFS family permease